MKDGWKTETLSDVCREITDGSHFSPKASASGFPYVTVRDIDEDRVVFERCKLIPENEFNQLVTNGCKPHKGDVLFSKDGTVGKVALVDSERDFVVLSSLAILRPNNARIDSAFLKYVMKSPAFLEAAVGMKTGVAIRRIILRNLRELRVPVPPLAEQQRIVGVLDEAFAALATAQAHAEKNLGNARALFESHLQSVFSRRGQAWERVTLETLLERGWIESHLDGNHGSDYPRKSEFISAGVPYISANCLDDNSVDMSRAKYLSPSRALLLRKGIAKNNDVLFAHNATVGPVAILRTDEPKVILGTSLTYYRCNPANLLPDYLAHYMRSSEFTAQYSQVMRQSTRNQVPITKQREFFHVVPPLGEQQKLIDVLDGLLEDSQRLQSIYQQKLTSFAELKRSFLHQAFTGAL